MRPGKIATIVAYFLTMLIFGEGCKTSEITYIGFITTRYPHKSSLNNISGAGKTTSDTIICARAVVELLGKKLTDSSLVRKSIAKSYFDTLYPKKYEIIIRNSSDSSKISVNSMDATNEIGLSDNELTNITINGYVYRTDFSIPSQKNFIILTSIPKKMSTYTNSSGYFEFININPSDLTLMVFDQYSWSFIEIPLKLRNLSSLNQIKILLTREITL
jgi:hypothetical protein